MKCNERDSLLVDQNIGWFPFCQWQIPPRPWHDLDSPITFCLRDCGELSSISYLWRFENGSVLRRELNQLFHFITRHTFIDHWEVTPDEVYLRHPDSVAMFPEAFFSTTTQSLFARPGCPKKGGSIAHFRILSESWSLRVYLIFWY